MKGNLANQYNQGYYDPNPFGYMGNYDALINALENGMGTQDILEHINEEKSEINFDGKNRDLLGCRVSDYRLLQMPAVVAPQFADYEVIYPGLISGTGFFHELGNETEYKLGCLFDYTTGLPYIQGSSLKGKLRSCFPKFSIAELKYVLEEIEIFNCNNFEKLEATKPPSIKISPADLLSKFSKAHNICCILAQLDILKGAVSGEKVREICDIIFLNADDKIDLKKDDIIEVFCLEQNIFEGCIFNRNLELDQKFRLPMTKHDEFFGGHISPETPGDTYILSDDTLNPHGNDPLKSPVPLNFIKLNTGIVMRFYFNFKDEKIIFQKTEGPHQVALGLTADKKLLLMNVLLLSFGIGAKTNVGYGSLDIIN